MSLSRGMEAASLAVPWWLNKGMTNRRELRLKVQVAGRDIYSGAGMSRLQLQHSADESVVSYRHIKPGWQSFCLLLRVLKDHPHVAGNPRTPTHIAIISKPFQAPVGAASRITEFRRAPSSLVVVQ